MKGPTLGLSQQVAEAEGSLTLEAQGRAGSSPDNAGTGRHCQTGRVRQARRDRCTNAETSGGTPSSGDTGSNLVDLGRTAVHARRETAAGDSEVGLVSVGQEATGKACGVPVARLQGKSWAPTPSTGSW